jgi:NADPH:quinone reductase-like Zn-dependent oxidoreductase
VTASQKHAELLTSYGASHVFNYRDKDVVDQIRKAAPGGKVDIALDCVGDEEKTVKPISKVVDAGSRVGILLPIRAGGYGSTSEVYMETKTQFHSEVKVVGIRTHHYANVGPIDKAQSVHVKLKFNYRMLLIRLNSNRL